MEDWTSRIERDVNPPPHLRGRIVRALRSAGEVRDGHARRAQRAWVVIGRIAVAVVIFAAGWFGGAAYDRASSRPPARFILFLHGGEAASAADESARVAEYGNWAAAERRSGRHVTGERLDTPASGFFIVEAPSLEDARALAAGHPHIRHGGTIDVKPIR